MCVHTTVHEQFNISNGHRIREKKTIKIRTSRIRVDERHNVSQLMLLYYYYVPITVVRFRRAR